MGEEGWPHSSPAPLPSLPLSKNLKPWISLFFFSPSAAAESCQKPNLIRHSLAPASSGARLHHHPIPPRRAISCQIPNSLSLSLLKTIDLLSRSCFNSIPVHLLFRWSFSALQKQIDLSNPDLAFKKQKNDVVFYLLFRLIEVYLSILLEIGSTLRRQG